MLRPAAQELWDRDAIEPGSHVQPHTKTRSALIGTTAGDLSSKLDLIHTQPPMSWPGGFQEITIVYFWGGPRTQGGPWTEGSRTIFWGSFYFTHWQLSSSLFNACLRSSLQRSYLCVKAAENTFHFFLYGHQSTSKWNPIFSAVNVSGGKAKANRLLFLTDVMLFSFSISTWRANSIKISFPI